MKTNIFKFLFYICFFAAGLSSCIELDVENDVPGYVSLDTEYTEKYSHGNQIYLKGIVPLTSDNELYGHFNVSTSPDLSDAKIYNCYRHPTDAGENEISVLIVNLLYGTTYYYQLEVNGVKSKIASITTKTRQQQKIVWNIGSNKKQTGETFDINPTVVDGLAYNLSITQGNDCISKVSGSTYRCIKPGIVVITAYNNGDYIYQPLKESVTIEIAEQKKEPVDLGLSVKWAPFNVGAYSPYSAGAYYSWGELQPKSKYDYSSCYTHNRPISDYSGDGHYDVATSEWGKQWRTPTSSEIEELFSCKWEVVIEGESSGFRIYGPNGNSIFLLASGYHEYNSLPLYGKAKNLGKIGYLWTSTPHNNSLYLAYYLYFDVNGQRNIDTTGRYYGFNVRPVYAN